MEDEPSFPPDGRIEMAESSNDKLERTTTVEPILDITQEILSELEPETRKALIEAGIDIGEDSGKNSRLAAGPSADIQGLDADNPVATSGEALASRSITNEELMELALHAASTGAKTNGRDWVTTHLKHVSPASLGRLVHAQTGILNKEVLHKRLDFYGMLSAPSARQAILLSHYLKENRNAIKDALLFCVGIGLHYRQTTAWVLSDGGPGPNWDRLMRRLEAEELQPPDRGFAKLLARLEYASQILYPQDPRGAQAAIASLHQAVQANPPSARLAPAATLPAGERLAAPGGNREIEAHRHQGAASDDELLMALARMWALSDKNLNCVPWIRQHTQSAVGSFTRFLTATGQLRCGHVINHLRREGRLLSPTARDLMDLSSFLLANKPARNLDLLSAGVGLNGNAVKPFLNISGELTGQGRMRVKELGHSTEAGRVWLLLQGLQQQPDTHP